MLLATSMSLLTIVSGHFHWANLTLGNFCRSLLSAAIMITHTVIGNDRAHDLSDTYASELQFDACVFIIAFNIVSLWGFFFA